MPTPETTINNLLNKAELASQKNILNWENELLRQYKLALQNIRLKIGEMYEKYGDKVTLGEMQGYNRLANLENEIVTEIRKLNSRSRLVTQRAIKDLFTDNYYRTGFAVETGIGAKLGFGQLNEKAIESAVYNEYDLIKWDKRLLGHNTQLTQTVRQEITQGLLQGKGFVETARSIKDKLNITANKAKVIVRTESTRAQAQGNSLALQKSKAAADRLGVEISYVWDATLDGKTRPNHGNMDGKTAIKDGEHEGMFLFTTMTGNKIYVVGPHETGTTDDINCRCIKRLSIKGLESKTRYDNESKKTIEYKNYNEWRKERVK